MRRNTDACLMPCSSAALREAGSSLSPCRTHNIFCAGSQTDMMHAASVRHARNPRISYIPTCISSSPSSVTRRPKVPYATSTSTHGANGCKRTVFRFERLDGRHEGRQPTAHDLCAESTQIQRKLSLKSTLGGRKVMVIWMPEKMNAECANKLLKLIEEPPAPTFFLLVSDEQEQILPTILSRTQRTK